jgi:hypothetical protein
MGTRNLTMVIADGKTKIAQYGQWDGYPSGQGTTALEFLHKAEMDKFKAQLAKCRFMTSEEVIATYAEIGVHPDDKGSIWLNMEQSAQHQEKYPQLSRDMAAEVLEWVYNNEDSVIKLKNEEPFAADSLFCEFAYVIDLDFGTFEVYQGFNQSPLVETERFYHLQEQSEGGYYPVKLLKQFWLNNLPNEEQFIKETEPQEEAEEAEEEE